MAPYLRVGLALLAVGTALITTLVSACGASPPADGTDAPAPAGGRNDSSAPPPTTDDASAPGSSAPDASAGALVPALVACGPLASACAATPSVAGLFATYRKDMYLDEAKYAEGGPLPTSGGRLHIAGIASASGEVVRVRIGGQTVDDLLRQKSIDWYHVWPAKAVAGEPLWVAFHSRDASWDSKASATVTVESASGALLAGTFPVAAAVVPLTYVTTTDAGKTVLVHARNVDTSPHTVARLLIDGKDVTAAACIPKKTLGPGEEALWTVPRCVAEKAGAAWTVVLELTDGPASAGVGRVLPELFPVEAWSRGSDCPLPGGNAAALAKHEGAGFDTQYMYFYDASCGLSGKALVNTTLPSLSKKLRVLVGDDFLSGTAPETQITDTSAVAGFLTGDESDGEYESNGFPAAELKARVSRRLWSMYPGVPTYNGGKTNKKVGAFAGMADVQGMDFYVAACAPHITSVNSPNPVRGAYDYLRNARNNHAPLPTWLYAQGLHAGWNKKVLGVTTHVQPDAGEILVQAISAALAGGKGLMWFQTDLDEAALSPERWDAVVRANRTIRAVRGWLREGDPAGLSSSTTSALVEGIRARDAIVVPIVDLDVTYGPNDLDCAKVFVGGPVPHFSFATHATEVRVRVPDDFAVDDVFEVVGQTVKDAPSYTIVGRELRFSLTLSQADPVRVLVVANKKTARATAAAGNAP